MRWGREAAGALPVACSTGRVLLTLRSQEVLEPGTWGIPGGRMEPNETAEDAAVREMREELGFDGDMILLPVFVYRETEFVFYNFVALVDDEFEPELDWENDDAGWFGPAELPEPLHFGVVRLFEHWPRIQAAMAECGQSPQLTRNGPVHWKEVVHHLDNTDPSHFAGRSTIGENADEYQWTLETLRVDELPRARVFVKESVPKYAELIRGGSKPPAIVIAERSDSYEPVGPRHRMGGQFEIWDGNHRLAAAARAGLEEVDVYVGRKIRPNLRS